MATSEPVYNATTEAPPTKSNKWFIVPTTNLDLNRFFIKLAEVLLSFVAFVLEELVNDCTSCGPLYFFEFVSCTAFLFTLLLLILLATSLHQRVSIDCWPTLDFGYTALIAVFFFIASISFASNNNHLSLEQTTVAFGFLASIAFLVDVIYFFMKNGVPCLKSGRDQVGGAAGPVPESEKLNSNRTNGTD
ncbi:CKLF-like MARVEL transmembrane domain-containing protein 6 [Trichomycterus rosablanca]|uniref:CKLF-like MARVEL transmembrane domain-containing protein 6 n=1 Tax=Trichomycterus rosablanca TaxID=2290929 RepID=UPI002F350A99